MKDVLFEVSLNKEFEQRLIGLIQAAIDSSLSAYHNSKAPKSDETPVLVSRIKVTELFGVSLTTIDKWRKWGLLPPEIKQGSRVYFSRQGLDDLLRSKARFMRDQGIRK